MKILGKLWQSDSRFYYILCVVVFLIGAVLRLKLWALNQGLQCDEANLVLRMSGRSYAGLFKPFDGNQVAPPMFLVFSKLVYEVVRFHQTAFFSDIVLRIVPLFSGIIAIPAFGYLLNVLFKNRMVNLLGMLLLSVNPAAISYSCIFKQYSMEMLVTILLLIICTKVDFKNKTFKYNLALFAVIGISSLFSMTALFIYPGIFLYLFIKAYKEKCLKSFLSCFGVFCILIILYLLLFLVPVYIKHYGYMSDYWEKFFPHDFKSYMMYFAEYVFRTTAQCYWIYFLVVISSVIMLTKDRLTFCLSSFMVVISYLFAAIDCYPVSERLSLYLFPCVLLVMLYPITLFPESYRIKYKHVIAVFLCFLIVYAAWQVEPLENIITKQEASRKVWEYLDASYDGTSTVIFAASKSTNVYYQKLYYKNFVWSDFNYSSKSAVKKYKKLSPGDYYMIITRCRDAEYRFIDYIYKNSKVYQCKYFYSGIPCSFQRPVPALLIKFRKEG